MLPRQKLCLRVGAFSVACVVCPNRVDRFPLQTGSSLGR